MQTLAPWKVFRNTCTSRRGNLKSTFSCSFPLLVGNPVILQAAAWLTPATAWRPISHAAMTLQGRPRLEVPIFGPDAGAVAVSLGASRLELNHAGSYGQPSPMPFHIRSCFRSPVLPPFHSPLHSTPPANSERHQH